MPSQLTFRPAELRDTHAISSLARSNILPATLPGWTTAAVNRLFDDSSPQAIGAHLENAIFSHVCIADGFIAGYINCKSPRLINLLVVSPSVQRSGIGSSLLAQALKHIATTASDVTVVEVTATEYSLPFYRRHSFYPISELIELDGRRLIRMAFWRKNPLLCNT
jgi:ribosomal protein S18 acetylase RimI-like enzyme